MTPAEAIDRVFDAWNHLDVEELVPLFIADARYEDPLFPAPVVGAEQLRAQVGTGMGELADCAIEAGHVVEQGDIGMVEARFLSSLADGSGRLDFDFAMLVEMRDGKVARLVEYFDTRPLV
jgi:ketosteroid isomerase-like protein